MKSMKNVKSNVNSGLAVLLSVVVLFASLPFAVFTASANGSDPFVDHTKNLFSSKNDPGGGGNGTETNPFMLKTVEDLEILADIVNGEDDYLGNAFDCYNYYFKLDKDIGSKGNEFKNRIGTKPLINFSGSFDGSECTIYLNLSDPEWQNKEYIGLFGYISKSATVQNVTVAGKVTGSQYVGGVVGYANIGTFVANCVNSAIVEGSHYVGGVVGHNTGTVINCTNISNITAVSSLSFNAGGVVGQNFGTVANSYNSGTVSGFASVGGVVGANCYDGGTIVNCASISAVLGTYGFGGVVGFNDDRSHSIVNYCYYNKSIQTNLPADKQVATTAIGGISDTANVKGLPHKQCVAASGTSVSCTETIDGQTVPLIDALNAYVTTYNANADKNQLLLAEGALSATGFTIPNDKVIDPLTHSGEVIKFCYWDKQTGDYYPHLSKATKEKPLTSVSVNMFIAKPAIGCRLLRAKAFSKTANVNVTSVRTTWFDGTHRIATKAHLGGKYTAMVSFKLATAEEYDIADGAKIWVRLNGKLVRATKRGDGTYTVMCSFKKLSICNVISDIYKNLFWRIF